jgi:OHCU decarboxylase
VDQAGVPVSDPRLPPIEALNASDPEMFVARLRPLFEAADPLATALYAARPFDSYAALIDRAAEIIPTLPPAQQVEVLNAHPRIGESAEAVRQVSSLSYREQGYEQEHQAPPDQLARVYADLADLNRHYEQRFGFRFVVFVDGRPKSEIVDVLRQRLTHSRSDELETGLHDMLAIARDRLRRLQ